MHLLHSSQNIFNLQEFGILIPIKEDRASRVWEELRKQQTKKSSLKMYDMTFLEDPLYIVTKDDIRLVHSPEHCEAFWQGKESFFINCYDLIDEDGNPYRYDPQRASKSLKQLRDPMINHIAGTIACCKFALENNSTFFLGGGMHHAHYDFTHGFCPVNDILIAIRKLQKSKMIQKALVIDTDAHRGDGTAAITRDDSTIQTLSIHMKNNWPNNLPVCTPKGDVAAYTIPSTIDIAMAKNEEEDYLPRLQAGIKTITKDFKPDLVVIVSGADTYKYDELPSSQEIQLSLEQMNARNIWMHCFFKELDLPQAWLMAGGYGDRSWEPVHSFLHTFQ